ncbi:twitching motility protein PilT [Nannocystis exedens]|uniref:Twitching motility protein PilT n=1 Tax=Nannocystis exedens TaxID=54 RepID=A0A1I2FF54_9BACT|nr:PilT/PilU family type 4a pilus ATPase [Nannocystis exedens]PCC70493.1 twitching motility protein [Nannocystis exedens]SFF03378.1 twitching motility protein PilT [Nannocystis exedens]
MAAIDSLLKILDAQKADGLVLASERVPSLKRAGADVPLSMPKVSHEMVAMFFEDLVTPEQRSELDARKSVKVEHTFEGQRFSGEIKVDGGRYHLSLAKARVAAGTGAARPVPQDSHPVPDLPPVRAAAPPPPARPTPVRAAAAPAAAAAPVVQEPVVEDMSEEPDEEALRAADELRGVLQRAHWEGAADVIFSAGLAPRVRTAGDLRELGTPASEAAIAALFASVLGPEQRARLRGAGSVDTALDLGGLRFRANLFRQQRGLSAALRPVRDKAPTLAELGLPDDFTALVGYPAGLVLFTGPTGSGKSTTLAALVEHVNRTAAKHVVTLEDPIEHVFTSKKSLIHQREVGRDVASFAEGLRASLREAPDIILLGEMRDPETISAALTAAETGHLVLSTLHAAGAAMAVDRIIDGFSGHQQTQVRLQLAGTLKAIVTQVLVPVSRNERAVAFEKMLVTAAVAAQIREGRGHQIATAIQTGRADGMVSLEQSLAALVRARKVSLEAAMSAAQDPEALRRSL